jgi:hypothetical protein
MEVPLFDWRKEIERNSKGAFVAVTTNFLARKRNLTYTLCSIPFGPASQPCMLPFEEIEDSVHVSFIILWCRVMWLRAPAQIAQLLRSVTCASPYCVQV